MSHLFQIGLLALPTALLLAQDELSLRQAFEIGLRQNESVAAAQLGIQAADARIAQARGGRLPKAQYTESFLRSNNPVFVFSSLLTQHQFTEQNFAVDALNRPDFLNNFQSLVTVDQPLYDAGQTRLGIRAAGLRKEISTEEKRRVEMRLIAGIARAYYGAVLAGQSLRAAEQAFRSAEADLKRAEAVRAAGMATDSDVLSIRVHLAAVRELQIQRSAELDVAQASLNDALGLPLDTPHTLTAELGRANVNRGGLPALEREGSGNRPEARESGIATAMAQVQMETARSALLPQVGLRGAFEADRQQFVTKGGSNWMVGVSLRWNLFDGADRARIAEAGFQLERNKAEQRQVDSAIRLEVRRAWSALRASEERIAAARAAIAQAEESLRITQNRYEAGLGNVTELLRTEAALLETRTRYQAAIHDQRIAAVELELAAGGLSPDSEVLK